MEYLTSEGYPLAAQKFALEANMQTNLDINSIQNRVTIRDAIHSGNIKFAIERINDMAPEVSRLLLKLLDFHTQSPILQ